MGNESQTTDKLWKGEKIRTASSLYPRNPWGAFSEKKAGESLDKYEKGTVVRMNQCRVGTRV